MVLIEFALLVRQEPKMNHDAILLGRTNTLRSIVVQTSLIYQLTNGTW